MLFLYSNFVYRKHKLLLLSFFFFQAEDGIRDLVRSRGLGDVYKRQDTKFTRSPRHGKQRLFFDYKNENLYVGELFAPTPVSYTHLTLPTSDLV